MNSSIFQRQPGCVWLRFYFLKARVGFMDQRCSETPHSSWPENGIVEALHSGKGHCYLQYTQPYSDLFYISSRINSSLPQSLFNRACLWKFLHRRQGIWLHQVADLACNNAVMTIQNHRIIVYHMPLAKTDNLGYTPINIIPCKGTVTLLHSSHFQALRSFMTGLHWTWHTVRNLSAA